MASGEMGLYLRFMGCAALAVPSDVLPVALLMEQHGLIPGDGTYANIYPAGDIPSMLDAHTGVYRRQRRSEWSVGFPVLTRWSTALNPSFGCVDIGDGVRFLTISVLIEAEDVTEINPYVDRLLAFALALYPITKPTLGWIDHWDANNELLRPR